MIIRGIGRVFITVGLLVLTFLAYQLYGTNALTGQTQHALASDLRKSWEIPGGTASPSPSPGATPPTGGPKLGDGVAIIKIPKIGVDKVVVEGTDVDQLKKGPGHYRGTAFPGELGNVVISGHRTTYGAPFYKLDEMQKGDAIVLEYLGRTYEYSVIEQKIVSPSDLSVVVTSTDARLTLTTCNPRFSAKQRLVIVAELKGQPAR